MKIAIIGARGVDTMEENLREAFVYSHNICEIFDIYDLKRFSIKAISSYVRAMDKVLRFYSDGYDKNIFKSLFGRVKDFSPDLVICVYRFIHPEFVRLCKIQGARIIHINPDQMTTLECQQIFASDYDAWFVKDPYMLDFMKNNMKLNTYLYNEAFNQRYHVKPKKNKFDAEKEISIDVMTYGNCYPYRVKMLKTVLDEKINLKVYGGVPRRFYNNELEAANQHKYITGKEKADLLYGSKIVFNQMHFAEVAGVNCRFFETNGCGAFQLSDYRPILHDLLPIDPQMVSFKNIDEGVDKIKYYLSHDKERYDIAQTIYNHFIKNYTYDNLVDFLLKTIM